MGAGDVKLMAAVGAFLGPLPALGRAADLRGRWRVIRGRGALVRSLCRVLDNLRLMGMVALISRSSGVAINDGADDRSITYALAIAVGTGLQLWLATQGSWPFK